MVNLNIYCVLANPLVGDWALEQQGHGAGGQGGYHPYPRSNSIDSIRVPAVA